jgi:hypothetical protein
MKKELSRISDSEYIEDCMLGYQRGFLPLNISQQVL